MVAVDRAALVMAGLQALPDGTVRYGLINHHREDQLPALARLTALVEANLRAAGIPVPHQ